MIDNRPFKGKCYKTKDDKLHATIFSRPTKVSKERWEQIFGTEEERLKKLEEFKKRREFKDPKNNAPNISVWDPEWTRLSTGRCMTKKELKRYCKEKGKVWING